MRYSLISAFILLLSNFCHSQDNDFPDSLRTYSEKVLQILKENSLNTDSVDWEELKNLFFNVVGQPTNKGDLGIGFKAILERLNDFHGAYFYRGKRYGITGPSKNFDIGLSPGFSLGAIVRTDILHNKYGYIFVPPMQWIDLDNRNNLARQLQDSICKVSEQNIKGWIIDLRLNLGGDMYAMLGGLSLFFEDGDLGKFIGPKSDPISWSILSSNVYEGNEKRTDLISQCSPDKSLKIAVLISPVTSSSGEIVAISFKDQQNALLIGECTSGYTTAVEIFKIDKESLMYLSVAQMTDRRGHYEECIQPDIEIEGGDNMLDLSKDKKVEAAINWIKEK